MAKALAEVTVLEETAGLRLRIARRRQWQNIIFLAVWLTGWGVGTVLALAGTAQGLIAGEPRAAETVMAAIMLGAWTLAWLAFLWELFGQEEAYVDGLDLALRRGIGRLGGFRRYRLDEITDLRLYPYQQVLPQLLRCAKGVPRPLPVVGEGAIAFDYQGRTYRFGEGLSKEDAERAIGLLVERYRLPRAAPLPDDDDDEGEQGTGET